jgi:hypothetical protein
VAWNQADATLMHTAIVAKNSDAASIHSACTQSSAVRGPIVSRYHSWKCCMPSSMGLW